MLFYASRNENLSFFLCADISFESAYNNIITIKEYVCKKGFFFFIKIYYLISLKNQVVYSRSLQNKNFSCSLISEIQKNINILLK